MSPDRGALRGLRAGVLALVALCLSAGAHVVGGGLLPHPAALAATGAAVAGACLLATRWRLSAGQVTALLVAGQLALHEVFMATAPVTATSGPAATSPHAGNGGHGAGAADLWLGGPSAADVAMLLAHAGAAVAVALAYSRGEESLWQLCAWLAPLAVLLARAEPVPAAALPRAPRARARARTPRWHPLRAVRRRGPPALLAA